MNSSIFSALRDGGASVFDCMVADIECQHDNPNIQATFKRWFENYLYKRPLACECMRSKFQTVHPVGALDSQGWDVPRYSEVISKIHVVVQAGHSAYPG